MNYLEFLQKLRETPRDWLIFRGQIRRLPRARAPQCPISALADTGSAGFHLVGTAIGLSPALITEIAGAADNDVVHLMRHLLTMYRRDLLEACGLQVSS